MPSARRVGRAACAGLALALLPLPAAVAAAPDAAEQMLSHAVRSETGDPGEAAARLAAAGFDVVSRDGETILVLGPASIRDRLDAVPGVSVTGSVPAAPLAVDAQPDDHQDDLLPRRLDGRHYPTFYGGYRTVEGYLSFSDDLAAEYPDLVRSVDYGESWSGDVLRAVCVTADADRSCQRDPDVDKARFLVVAQTHARELTTSELMWRLLTYLVDGYGRNAQVTALLDGTEIWVVPQVNPDGIRLVEDGITEEGVGSGSSAWQRKNVNDSYSDPPCSGPWSSSQEGVDLNRNFDIDWGRTGTSRNPCSLTYGGPGPASEPETVAQVDLMRDLFRDQRAGGMEAAAPRSATGSMLTLHSYANQVLLPWGFTTEHAPNEEGLRSYAFRMSHFNGYAAGQSGEILYNSSGATEDWAYADLGIAGFTWEIGPGGGTCAGFFPAFSCQDGFWDTNRDALLYAAEAARRPYALTLGPTVLDPSVKQRGEARVRISARGADDAYGTSGVGRPDAQDVATARVFVGRAPWDGGRSTLLRVIGDGPSAKLIGVVDAPRRRTLAHVQARDADGSWGPTRAVWLPAR